MSNKGFNFTFASDPDYEHLTDGLNLELYHNDKLLALCYRSKKNKEVVIEFNKYVSNLIKGYPDNTFPLEKLIEGILLLKEKSKEI